ncbi:hypothetical protein P5673_030677 [Acropora cervicornis]|uniref:Uncharacterized protein n=1 Tax=Acropora cervicornis TaxID=6130 RepID=A0AAD9UT81_ACRCE|nr:hypothetical protein P5673_030677 [Acropora cervicornis]
MASFWEKTNANVKCSGTYEWTSLVGSDKTKLMELLQTQLEQNDIIYPETKQRVIKLWPYFCVLDDEDDYFDQGLIKSEATNVTAKGKKSRAKSPDWTEAETFDLLQARGPKYEKLRSASQQYEIA